VNGVARSEVPREMLKRVQTEMMGQNDDSVAYEKAVSFVAWQGKFIETVLQLDRGSLSDFLPVLQGGVIGEGEFA
jgi:hypothetical protein